MFNEQFYVSIWVYCIQYGCNKEKFTSQVVKESRFCLFAGYSQMWTGYFCVWRILKVSCEALNEILIELR